MTDSARSENLLKIAIAVLVIVILAFGSYFGWTVYRDREAAKEATPALRVIHALETEIRKTPNDVILRVRLGEAYAAAGKSQEAIKQLNAGLKIDPKHTGALLDLGQIAMMEGRPSEARSYFKQVVSLTDSDQYANVSDRRETALFQLGRLELSVKEYEAAIGDFKGALRIRKDASDTYYYLSRAFYGVGDIDQAISQLQIAVRFDPNLGPAQYFLAELYQEKKDDVSAAYHFALAGAANRDAPEPRKALAKMGTAAAWLKKARSAKDAGDQPAALDAVLIALSMNPNDENAASLQADIENLDREASLAYYKALLKRDPGNIDAAAAVARLKKVLAEKKPKKKSSK